MLQIKFINACFDKCDTDHMKVYKSVGVVTCTYCFVNILSYWEHVFCVLKFYYVGLPQVNH